MKEVESQRLFLVHWDVLRVRVVAFQDILDEHEHCGWGNPLDLTVKATTSSSFEEGDGLRIYIYIYSSSLVQHSHRCVVWSCNVFWSGL